MSGHIYPEPLTIQHAASLEPRVRKADRDDLKNHRAGAEYALALALTLPGEAWAIMWAEDNATPVVIGAGGWTEAGAVWTLWADLTLAQSKAMMRMIVPYARILAIRANRPLWNYYGMRNDATEKFLKATRCVDFTGDVSYFSGRYWNKFMLKPLEDMPHV